MHDAVASSRRHPGCAAARDEPVEDRLNLVGGRVPGRAQSVARDGIALLAQLRLAEPLSIELDHFRTQHVPAEACVGRGVVAAEQMVHMQRRHAVAERAEGVPQAGRVSSPGDEAADLAARLDQVIPADVLFDPCAQHGGNCRLGSCLEER